MGSRGGGNEKRREVGGRRRENKGRNYDRGGGEWKRNKREGLSKKKRKERKGMEWNYFSFAFYFQGDEKTLAWNDENSLW